MNHCHSLHEPLKQWFWWGRQGVNAWSVMPGDIDHNGWEVCAIWKMSHGNLCLYIVPTIEKCRTKQKLPCLLHLQIFKYLANEFLTVCCFVSSIMLLGGLFWKLNSTLFGFFYFFNWSIVDVQHFISFRYTTERFNICTHYDMITMVNLVTISHHTKLGQVYWLCFLCYTSVPCDFFIV